MHRNRDCMLSKGNYQNVEALERDEFDELVNEFTAHFTLLEMEFADVSSSQTCCCDWKECSQIPIYILFPMN